MSVTLLPIQATLNGLLKTDPQVCAAIQALQGQAIAVCVKPLTRWVYVDFSPTGISLNWQPQITPTLTLSITPNAILRLQRGEPITALISAQDITFSGDMALGEKLQQIIQRFHFDWEELLAQFIGDVPTHFIASRLHKSVHAFKKIREKIATDTGIFLQEEKRCLPTPFAIENWMNDIDTLRADTDRLAARIQQLEDSP